MILGAGIDQVDLKEFSRTPERRGNNTSKHVYTPWNKISYGRCKRMKGNALMPEAERCCFKKRPPDDSLFLIIHVGQQDSLTETIEAALTSGGEFGNGKN